MFLSAADNLDDFQYKVPRIYFKIPRVLPYKDQKEKFETDDFFKKLQREGEVRVSANSDRIFTRNGRAMSLEFRLPFEAHFT